MKKRLALLSICLLLILSSGCSFFTVPSPSPAPSNAVTSTPAGGADATATVEPTTVATDEPTAEPTPTPTEEPTPTPTVEPTPTPDPTEGMIFPKSDTELLKWKDLIALKADKLDLARNEIFARAGYQFTKQSYIDYYGKLSWYQPSSTFSESSFTDIQKANITLIRVAESAIRGKLYYVPSGTVLDFDQDGTLDKLTYSSPDEFHMNLKIKEGNKTTPWNISCENPSKKVYLGDIDFKDGMLDLFVDEFGPSSDNFVYISGIKHNSFLNRTASGTLPGQINQIKLDGKGNITTTRRMDILMTWFATVKYKLSSGKIKFAPQSSYSMGNYKCKMLVDIPLKAKASSSAAVAFTVPAGTSVTLVSTDDKKWIKIKAPAGTAWLEMKDTTTLANPAIFAGEAFDGLNMAD